MECTHVLTFNRVISFLILCCNVHVIRDIDALDFRIYFQDINNCRISFSLSPSLCIYLSLSSFTCSREIQKASKKLLSKDVCQFPFQTHWFLFWSFFNHFESLTLKMIFHNLWNSPSQFDEAKIFFFVNKKTINFEINAKLFVLFPWQ